MSDQQVIFGIVDSTGHFKIIARADAVVGTPAIEAEWEIADNPDHAEEMRSLSLGLSLAFQEQVSDE